MDYKKYKIKNVVIGSGCAAFNCADWLWELGERDTAIITEGVNAGTSRNAGSDKQTYYKLSLCADSTDSIDEMAETLFSGGAVNGDIALAEAAGSVKCFMKLANLGVRFPTNRYGEYVGYKTDHDPRCRATSAGPLTSKFMTEALEKSVSNKGIRIIDRMMAVRLVTSENQIVGVVAIDLDGLDDNYGITVFECENVVMATGGPAGIYENVVYPESQSGMSGMALSCGAKGANLQEWQYGLASVDFRWNVSGTYQQVLPRFVSVDDKGEEREFLGDYISAENTLLYQFRKGYQWPFTSSNIPGSSEVDIAVQSECAKGRRVYMDFMHNPSNFTSVEELPEEARNYLLSSGAVQGTPIERLMHMNPAAVKLYSDNGIDITKDMLRIAVCAQHCNGGIDVDENWETCVKGLYVAGEAAGTFGIHRPGGSALNSTQVGSMRAAEHIAYKKIMQLCVAKKAENVANELFDNIETALRAKTVKENESSANVKTIRSDMSRYAAHLRSIPKLKEINEAASTAINNYWGNYELESVKGISAMLKGYDSLVTTVAVSSAMLLAAERYGSRGGSTVLENESVKDKHGDENCVVVTLNGKSYVEAARPIPKRDVWFETCWADYIQRTKK